MIHGEYTFRYQCMQGTSLNFLTSRCCFFFSNTGFPPHLCKVLDELFLPFTCVSHFGYPSCIQGVSAVFVRFQCPFLCTVKEPSCSHDTSNSDKLWSLSPQHHPQHSVSQQTCYSSSLHMGIWLPLLKEYVYFQVFLSERLAHKVSS